ncbi:MAG: beta-propeller domain-containing protein, partial [Myxococcota bacterium]|nr:beta-propeller domain-containing protein [Myxococcota bacterium]
MHKKTAIVLLGTAALIATGCSGTRATETVDVSHTSLLRMQSCGDLTAALREDARSKMNRRIDAEIRAIQEGWGYGYGHSVLTASVGAGAAAAPPSNASDMAASNASVPSAPAHSNTETQVAGVDEADIVKTDGDHIYLLHGDHFLVVDSWPATSLAMATAMIIEGQPTEMFVANARAVVFSTVDGTPIYAAAQVTPRPGYSDSYFVGSYGGGMGVADTAIAALPRSGATYPGSVNPLTKVTVLALSGTQATVTREIYFEG